MSEREFICRVAWFVIRTLVYALFTDARQIASFRKEEAKLEEELLELAR